MRVWPSRPWQSEPATTRRSCCGCTGTAGRHRTGDLLLVVRGGRNSLSDAVLERAAADTWERHRFFGVSVFGAPDDDLADLSRREPAIRRREQVRVARVGVLRQSGFEVVPTFPNPAHHSVVMEEVESPTVFASLRACFSGSQPNPGLPTRPVRP